MFIRVLRFKEPLQEGGTVGSVGTVGLILKRRM